MQPLDYIALYMHRPARKGAGMRSISVNLITNFTDDILERVLGGMCIAEGIYPRITRAPYKQYAIAFKDKRSIINRTKADISYIFFDASPYQQSEFLDSGHRREILADIKAYAQSSRGTVVVSLFVLPYRGPYGHFFTEEPLFRALSEFNADVRSLTSVCPTLHVVDTNKAFHHVGEGNARDLRGHHAFNMPFTTDFLAALASEWLSYSRAILGLSRKCIVLDLDYTLWGGVLGEEGPLGITLGPVYPGVAYQNFQHSVLSLWERGIILAVSSKNNEADVEEVFKKNPHMILKREHFAGLRANWEDKSKNVRSLAEELNIGLESMVFIDDSPVERERMRREAPQVLTPEWSTEPEQYARDLFALTVFHQMALTAEDKKRGEMYAQEYKRREARGASGSVKDYIAALNITMRIAEGTAIDSARAAQMTQKTNQFNLTTKRYTESDIKRMIKRGDMVITGEVSDTFGGYGVVILAIIAMKKKEAVLDTFLMSCRVMGRGVEKAFLEHVATELHARGVATLSASFIPTRKNEPISKFLPAEGMEPLGRTSTKGVQRYELALGPYVRKRARHKGKSVIAIIR